jgi:CDP-glucose 4,6-dehydratase
LATWLSRLGAEVTGFSLPPLRPSLWERIELSSHIRSIYGNICDEVALAAAVSASNPEVVLHLAAQALVRQSYEQPIETLMTNVMGTAHVVNAACRSPRIRAIVCVTTDKCYENREWLWPYRETDALGGHDPYSASKACAELVVSAWRRSYLDPHAEDGKRLGLSTARAGNVIGGGDWSADRLVPDCITAFEAGREVEIRNPLATRPWQHVLEPLCGYLLLAERLCEAPDLFGMAWNFGPETEDVIPVLNVAGLLADAWGEGASWRVSPGPHPHEAGLLAVDAARARAHLSWRPRLGVAEALQWTCQWYKQVLRGGDAHRAVEADIERYELIGKTH